MATFNDIKIVTSGDIVTQITGFGDQMGIDIIITAPDTKKIVVEEGATIQLTWTEGTEPNQVTRTIAQALSAGNINDTTGLLLGVYYPDGQVFTNQGEVDAFMGTVAAKIYKATIQNEV